MSNGHLKLTCITSIWYGILFLLQIDFNPFYLAHRIMNSIEVQHSEFGGRMFKLQSASAELWTNETINILEHCHSEKLGWYTLGTKNMFATNIPLVPSISWCQRFDGAEVMIRVVHGVFEFFLFYTQKMPYIKVLNDPK